jgi:hypothetical protein
MPTKHIRTLRSSWPIRNLAKSGRYHAFSPYKMALSCERPRKTKIEPIPEIAGTGVSVPAIWEDCFGVMERQLCVGWCRRGDAEIEVLIKADDK